MGPAGTETKYDCAGEGQQQSARPEQARWHDIPEVSSISIHGLESLKKSSPSGIYSVIGSCILMNLWVL
jgi:hypothetical protein